MLEKSENLSGFLPYTGVNKTATNFFHGFGVETVPDGALFSHLHQLVVRWQIKSTAVKWTGFRFGTYSFNPLFEVNF